ncbi:transcriptional regulator [Helicobacter sp. MIT 00-7814]|uniref:helix-turn-helix transcriptional regulator n=1 Tax=unclassified Helicobacter TaxID=2593540 RepID=UPI000E1F9B6E|nr:MULTISPECIES: helix-turn-helix transcriptional regulator [unclassified Helicobacter]RDU51597.1 transcriptional regulator [Helicobacter sp. MIT 99-10781]RDU52533.1 transcriptional regulator [Helicobacter sp. MIT 00-7814]
MKTLNDFKQQALQNPKIKAHYDELETEFIVKSKLIAARKEANLTQEQLAKKMHTTKSVVSRLESLDSKISPRLSTLRSYAKALGKDVRVDIV